MAITTIYDEIDAGLVDGMSDNYYSNENDSYYLDSVDTFTDNLLAVEDNSFDKERAAELKKAELFRKGKLEYEDNGELINDSNNMIRAKEVANAGISAVDWLLEASENIADFGQGDLLNNSQFQAEIDGRHYNMQNKDIIGARNTTTQDLIKQYQSATNDPNAEYGVYTLKKFDGYNPDGSEKFLYKYGTAGIGADARYNKFNKYMADGYEIVEEKRFTGAQDWEKKWNASKDVLDNRAFDASRVNVDGTWMSRDEASKVNFGSGYTELLNKDLLGTDVGKTQEDYDKNREYSKRLTAIANQRYADGLENSAWDALQSGATKAVVDTADFFLDVITPGDNTLLNDVKKQENIDKWVGYDRTGSTQVLNEAKDYWKNGDYLTSIGKVLTDPNTMIESIPMMLSYGVGSGKFTAAAKLLNKANKARSLGKIDVALRAEKIAKTKMTAKEIATYEKFKDQSTLLNGLDHIAKNAGFHTAVGSMTNNVLDDRIAEKIKAGESPDVGMDEVLGVYALQMLMAIPDRVAFSEITGLDQGAQILKKAFSSLNKEGKTSVMKNIATKAGTLVAEGAGEGAQEYFQTWGEILGAKAFVDGKGFSETINDQGNQDEALMGYLGGLGAGAQMGIGGMAIKGIKDKSTETINNYKDKKIQEAQEDIPVPRHTRVNEDIAHDNITLFDDELDVINNYINNPDEKTKEAVDRYNTNIDTTIDNLVNEQVTLDNTDPKYIENAKLLDELVKKSSLVRRVLDGQYEKETESDRVTGELKVKVPESVRSEGVKGTYNKIEVLDELNKLLVKSDTEDSTLDTYNKLLDKAEIEDFDGDIKELKLGSSRAVLNRFKKTLDKLENSNALSDEEQVQADNYRQAIEAFETKLNAAFNKKIKNISLDEINNMTLSESIDTFGAGANIFTNTSEDNPFVYIPTNEELAAGTQQTSTDSSEPTNLFTEGLPETFEKVAAIQDKQGNTEGAEQTKKTGKVIQNISNEAKEAKAKAKKASRLTSKNMVDKDLFEDGGIFDQIAEQKIRATIDQAHHDSIQKTIKFTENWIKENTPEGTTAPTVEQFLSKGFTGSNRAGYYSAINADPNLVSIYDSKRKLESSSNKTAKLKTKIINKIKTKKKRSKAIGIVLSSMKQKILDKVEDLKTNGVRGQATTTEELLDITSKSSMKYTPEQLKADPKLLVEALLDSFNLQSEDIGLGKDNKKLEVSYEDYIHQLFPISRSIDGKVKGKGILEILDNLNEEFKIYSSLIDSDGNLVIPTALKTRKTEVDKKNKVDGETLSDTEVDTKTIELKNLEDKLYDLQQKINEANLDEEILVDDGYDNLEAKINKLEKEVIEKTNNLGDVVKELLIQIKALENQIKDIKAPERKLEKELRLLNKDLDDLVEEAKEKEKELNKLNNITSKNKNRTTLVKRHTVLKKITAAYKKLWNSTKNLANGSVKILKDLISINKQIHETKNEIKTKEQELARIKYNNKDTLKTYNEALRWKQENLYNAKQINPKIKSEEAKLHDKKEKVTTVDKTQEVYYDDNGDAQRNKTTTTKTTKGRINRAKDNLYRKKNVLIKKINRLKKAIEKPFYSDRLLVKQRNRAIDTKRDDKAINAVNETGLPVVFSDFTTTSKKATSLLSRLPIKKIGSKTLTALATVATKFFKDIELGVNGKQLKSYLDFRQPGVELLVDEKGNIDENVATAIYAAMYTVLRNQSSKMRFKDREQVANMLGITEYEVTDEMLTKFSPLSSRASVAHDIGTAVVDYLDLKARQGDGDTAAFGRLRTGLGLIGVAILEEQYMDSVEIPLKEYEELVGDNYKLTTENNESTVNFLQFKDKDTLNKTELDAITAVVDDLEETSIIPQEAIGVQFTEPKEMTAEELGIRGNDVTLPTSIITKALNLLKKQVHYLLLDPMKYLDKLDRIEAIKLMGYRDEDEIKADKEMSSYDKKTAIAQNLGIERAYDELYKLKDKVNNRVRKNKFWFNWFTPKNNRLNINSVLIDPQNEKELHRWLVPPKLSLHKFKKSDIDANTMETIGFKFGIAQAFGYDIDKEVPQDTIAYATELMNMELDDLFKLATTRTDKGKTNFDHLGHAMQALSAIEAYKNASANETFEAHISAEFDGVTNGSMIKTMQIPLSEDVYKILVKGGFVFKGQDNADGKYQSGVTYDEMLEDGMLTQIGESTKNRKKGIIGKVLDVYFSQGIIARIKKADIVKRLLASKKDKEAPISTVDPMGLLLDADGNALKDDLFMQFIPDIDKGLTKELRDLLKDPTLTTNYGSALTTVIKNIARNTTNKAITKLLKDYHGTNKKDQEVAKKTLEKMLPTAQLAENLKIDGKSFTIKNINDLVVALGNIDLHKLGKGKNNIQEHLETMLKATLGSAISEAVEETFGDLISTTEVVNVTSRYMMRIFEQAMAPLIEKTLAEKNKANKAKGIEKQVMALSQDEIIDLTKQLKHYLPIFDGPASSDRLEDGIFIFDSGLAKEDDIPYSKHKPAVRYKTKSGETRNISTKIFVKKLAEAYSAAGVIPTHTEDAVHLAKTIIKHISTNGIIPIHDAIVIGGLFHQEIVKSMNENFIETNKGYENINSIAKAAREVYNKAKLDDTIDMSDMRSDKERKAEEERASKAEEEYIPISMLEKVIEMEQIAEKVWEKRRALFADDVVVDQFPSINSAVESKATYDIEQFIEEGNLRIERRLESLSKDNMFASLETETKRKLYLKALFKIDEKNSIKHKTEYNIEMIKILTKILNGAC